MSPGVQILGGLQPLGPMKSAPMSTSRKRTLRNNIDVIEYFADDNEMCE